MIKTGFITTLSLAFRTTLEIKPKSHREMLKLVMRTVQLHLFRSPKDRKGVLAKLTRLQTHSIGQCSSSKVISEQEATSEGETLEKFHLLPWMPYNPPTKATWSNRN